MKNLIALLVLAFTSLNYSGLSAEIPLVELSLAPDVSSGAFEMPEKPTAPRTMGFCGMNLELTPGCRAKVQEMIDRLYKSPQYFQSLVERCDTYMPFVEDAFNLMKVPEDLKYIVILESALIGDAVSRSNAVGFWQFKDFTAREVGLIVGPKIDERKHIFRSSLGAAKYFSRINRDFDNWIYSIIGYNQGPSGALPYTKARYYGARSMVLGSDLHPYAVKSLAHKIAFQYVLGKNDSPKIWLEPKPTQGETSVLKLAKEASVTVEELQKYNLWIKNYQLPRYVPFTYYVPHNNELLFANQSDPNREQYLDVEPDDADAGIAQTRQKENDPFFGKPNPERKNKSQIRAVYTRFENREITHDPDYGEDFVVSKEGDLMVEIATKYDVSLKKLLVWNNVSKYHPLKPGKVIRLQSKKKTHFHIVQKGETLDIISEMYDISPQKLRKKNRMDGRDEKVYAGQKLYLKKKKPAKERIVLFKFPWTKKEKSVKDQKKSKTKTPKPLVEQKSPPIKKSVVEADPSARDLKVSKRKEPQAKLYKTKWVWHTVEKGQTLWQLYKLYNCPVDVIKKLNSLPNNDLKPGQKLKIMAREEIVN